MRGEGEGSIVGSRASEGGEVGGFCSNHVCLLSRRVVVEDETIVFGLPESSELRHSHGFNGNIYI